MKRSPSRTTIRLVLEAHDPRTQQRYDALSGAIADLHVRVAQLEVSLATLQSALAKLQQPELPLASLQTDGEDPKANPR